MNVDERLRNVDQASHLAHVSLALMQRLSWRCSLDKQAFHDADTDTDTDSDILADILARMSRECRRVVQLAIGITSGCPCRCQCRCRRRGIPTLRCHFGYRRQPYSFIPLGSLAYRLYVLSELYLISFLFNDFCISVISGYTAKMVCISSQTTDLALKGHCHGNPFSGKKLANQPSFGSMAF